MLRLREDQPEAWAWLLSFMSHLETRWGGGHQGERRLCRREEETFQSVVAEVVAGLAHLGVDAEEEVVGHLAGVMATNAVCLETRGQAFFPLLCLASHSCLPRYGLPQSSPGAQHGALGGGRHCRGPGQGQGARGPGAHHQVPGGGEGG